MTFLTEYGLFLAKTVTFLLAIGAIILMIVSTRQPKARKGELVVTDLSSELEQGQFALKSALASKAERKVMEKQQKEEQKKRAKAGDERSRLFVLDFNGSMDAKEVASLREEVSAVIGVAQPGDEVLLRLESGGGVVHGYGLAASQLQRLRDRDIKLTVAIDKVAASGGYMMACVADKILAAPLCHRRLHRGDRPAAELQQVAEKARHRIRDAHRWAVQAHHHHVRRERRSGAREVS